MEEKRKKKRKHERQRAGEENDDDKHRHSSKKRSKEKRRRKREKRAEEDVERAASGDTADTKKAKKVAARLFDAINRCGSDGSSSSGKSAALHDLRYYIDRLRVYDTDPTLIVDDSGRTLLQRAVLQNNARVCRMLIDCLGKDMINLCAGSEDASTALHYACLNKNATICYLLWQNGAESDIKNSLGMAADDMGFGALRIEGERCHKEDLAREEEWRLLDESMRQRAQPKRKLGDAITDDQEELDTGQYGHGNQDEENNEESHTKEEPPPPPEEDFHIFDYTEGTRSKNKRPTHKLSLDFERWKEMERNKWRREQEEREWAEKLQEEMGEDGAYLRDWCDREDPTSHLDDEQWKDWIRKEMARKASKRWGADHADFYDTNAQKRREERRKDQERRKRQAEADNNARLEREEREKQAKKIKLEQEKRKLDWERLEHEWTLFESSLGSRESLKYTDIPFPNIEADEKSGQTLAGFDFLSQETTADEKAKYLRTVFLRWHPDKFEQRVGHLIQGEERDRILAEVTRITQHITRIKDLLSRQEGQGTPAL